MNLLAKLYEVVCLHLWTSCQLVVNIIRLHRNYYPTDQVFQPPCSVTDVCCVRLHTAVALMSSLKALTSHALLNKENGVLMAV